MGTTDAGVRLTAVVVGAVASHAAAQAYRQDEVLHACEAAFWKQTFDDATAAGLNPPAMSVSFEARKAVTTGRNGKLIVVGKEDYRPAMDVPAFPVRYECVADPGTGTVESITYTAIGTNGASSVNAPTVLVREASSLSGMVSRWWST